jgi:hypothetical protein
MMSEELGFGAVEANEHVRRSPPLAAFLLVGSLPLLVFVYDAVTPAWERLPTRRHGSGHGAIARSSVAARTASRPRARAV